RGHPLLFTEQHMVEIEQNTRIEQALLNADLNAELTVFYQPIIAIDTGKTMAFEALARWTSPVLGNVPPSDFIPVAERAGLISEMTRILLKKALTTASHWPDNVGLSFNLSAHDISSSQAVSLIVGTILASGVDPKRLDLELTETAMLHDFAQAKAAIDMLKLLGCGIALDDFGTGYSSLSQLHALPLTKIKIDRSFVSNLDRNPASYKIVKSLLALSTDMGLGCVVEGVETKEELAALNILGGRLVQGYFYSPPVPASELERFLPQTTSPAQMAG
ncbi:EAL domain-containing protein, partial [Hoeflea sp.]|uniref:putative bifunctional diguanylate cyclase/phosphodiesterase n=1 Tax=Hoeflea sp. TaxID=1940281 RepID=UPI002AFEF36F